jgi:hypothetical protein
MSNSKLLPKAPLTSSLEVSELDSVTNFSRDEVEIALKIAKKTVSISMLQKIHSPDTDITDNFDDGHDTNNLVHVNDNDIDDKLLESTTVETDCIDFGLRALYHENVPISEHYDENNSTMPRAKELVSLVDASKIPKERGFLVKEALDKIIFMENVNIASEKPPQRGTLVSGCPVGKVPITNVS